MKTYIRNTGILLGCFMILFDVKGQIGGECYKYENITLSVNTNMCTKQWMLTGTATNYGSSPYCYLWGCYQYEFFKNGTRIQQELTTSSSHTFYIDYDEPGNYQIIIVTTYITTGANYCDNGYTTIAIDLSNAVNLTHFCVPSITFSNVNSGAGTLPLYGRTLDYIQTQNNVTVSANTNVVFYSQGNVVMNPGFSTENNSNFLATIVNCNSTATSCPAARIASEENTSTILSLTGDDRFTDFNIYPNPAKDVVHINTGKYKGMVGTVVILNALGEKIKNLVENDIIKESYEIETNNLSGLYLLQISTSNKLEGSTKKFVVND